MTDTAEKLQPAISPSAEEISRKFTKTFTLFGACHDLYNSREILTDQAIAKLGKQMSVHRNGFYIDSIQTACNIKNFMKFYRDNFPEASVLPKMHFMEDHVVPWLKEYGLGLGLMGEQGAESIHASVNSIKRAYACVPDRVKRLECILQEHHRKVCPILVEQQPALKKRKKSIQEGIYLLHCGVVLNLLWNFYRLGPWSFVKTLQCCSLLKG